ncbi:helix-turn-helix domain-containing protein [Bifidobacterium pseudocatenulatum]|uniref:Helix-turn-helix domain-containing protein n=2 Tax=Bifidobacterium pseudocatenulatum TaxID=28026 RepID=A0AAQ0LUZ6_BIFPS|nr:helix-turn-helix domain-containing protein [Bifidobacterium pseudocatenulatum]RGN30773.1 helix-turn-helix domain-containing protein [Bifidobacterium pseudocatenulatum]RHJ84292.1 helix-turn-helix domain-containing protein [Bifidobacterium pseudocatenulatum]RHL97234.1 helix-turn-helix domain-containing protein [Bifidobacterium pseudocatenulatum]
MVWVQEHVHEVRNATKAVLSYLAFKARYDDGTAAWPAIGTIAGACGLSEKTVQRSIDQLLDLGLIEPGQQNFSAINPKTGEPVRRNYQTIVWNVICKESNLPTEPCEDPSASKVRAAMKRAERAKAKMSPLNQTDQNDGESSDKMSGTADKKQTKRAKAKMSPLKNGGNKPILTDSDKMSPLESQDGTNDVVEDKMSEKLDKMSPNNTLKYNYPSLPTGELPASGKRPTGEDGKNETGRSSEAVTVMDHLTAIRSKLSLTTSTPTKRDHAKIGNLVSRVAKAHDADRAVAVALILAVIDWLPANTYWLRRIDSARRLADNWDQIANDWTVSQLENQRERDTEARTRGRKPISKPTPIPDHHSERHVHTLMCEHVLNDMKPHEAEYDHEGSLRSGHPSEWQLACMRHAAELNQRDGLDKAA